MNDSRTRLYNTLMGNPGVIGTSYRAIGRTSGGSDDNFFTKRAKSIENAFGTTGAALVSAIDTANENQNIANRNKTHNKNMSDIYKKYGYNSSDDYYNAKDATEKEIFGKYGFDSEDYWNKHADLWTPDNSKDSELKALEATRQDVLNRMSKEDADKIKSFDRIQDELKGESSRYAKETNKASEDWRNYRTNSYVGQKVNQDRGKFAGSAINTLSTMTDVLLPTAGVALNSVQGGIEGIADELEDNGLQNFDWGRAGQNALIGATSGAVTGGLNKGLSNALAKRGGNLFKGGNKLTQSLNNLGSKTTAGRVGSTLATGVGRGALSGAAGGATGAGLSAAMNGQDVLGSALQGAVQGAQQGAVAGGVMAGANMAASKTPGVGDTMRQLNEAGENWQKSGNNFNERLTNTLTSGDSGIGNWLQGKPSRMLASAGQVGNSIRNVGDNNNPLKGITNASEAADIINDPESRVKLISEIAERAETLKGQPRGKYGTNSWDNDLFEYRDIDEKVLNTLGISGDLDGPRAAAVTQVLKEKGIIPDGNSAPTTASLARGAGYNNEAEAWEAYAKYKNNLAAEEYQNRLDSYNAAVEAKNGDFGYNDKTGRIIDVDNRYIPPKYSADELNAWLLNNQQAQTPNTLGGWLKKAGERIVEDANNRGVGMSIKDVGDDRIPLDESMQRIRNVKNDVSDSETIGKLPLDYMAGGTESPDINYISRIANEKIMAGNAKNLSIPELAYSTNNYNRAKIIEFDKNGTGRLNIVRPLTDGKTAVIALEKQPDGNTLITTIRPDADSNYIRNLTKNKGASVLYDTTDGAATASIAGAPAASRAIAGGNDSIIPQADQNVNANMQIPQDIQNMRVANNTVEEPTDLTSVFNPNSANTMQSRNRLQSVGQQLQNAAKTQKYGTLYDSLDAKTAARAVQTGAPEALSKLGVRPENYLEAAKTSNYVNQVISDLADKSGVKVSVPDLPNRLSLDNVDVVMSDQAAKKYNNYIKQIMPDGDTPDVYSAGYLLQKSRELGNKAANLRGNTDDVTTLRAALTDAKYKLRDLAANALENAEITGDLTNDNIANGLAKLGANQAVQDYYTEAVNGKAPGARDYIRRSSLFEQARDMGTQIEAEKYTRSASKAPTNPMTRIWNATGLDQPVNTLLRSTVAPIASGVTNLAGKAVEGIGNAEARIRGNGDVTTRTPVEVTPVDPNTLNPQTRIYNAIGRTEGGIQGDNARYADYLANTAQEAETVPNTGANTLEALATPMGNTGATSLYDSIYGTQTAQTDQYAGFAPEDYFYAPTGDNYTDMLSRAMKRAQNAEDYSALDELYSMYQNALATTQKLASSNNTQQKLSDTQRRAYAAENSLNELMGMTPDLAYTLSDIPVIGNIATLGGNSYDAAANSLATQIGYMMSGANIKEEEAQRIGQSYVPQPFDNEAIRQQKLQRARQIIEQYKNTYGDTGSGYDTYGYGSYGSNMAY